VVFVLPDAFGADWLADAPAVPLRELGRASPLPSNETAVREPCRLIYPATPQVSFSGTTIYTAVA